jgi:hypothetical protein
MQSVRRFVPGRKTDVSDAAWLCQLLEAGLLRASFVPPKPVRALLNFTSQGADEPARARSGSTRRSKTPPWPPSAPATAGTLTAAQAKQMLSGITKRVTAFVDGKGPFGSPPRGGRGAPPGAPRT